MPENELPAVQQPQSGEPAMLRLLLELRRDSGRLDRQLLSQIIQAASQEWYPIPREQRDAIVNRLGELIPTARNAKELSALTKAHATLQTLNLKLIDTVTKAIDQPGDGDKTNVNVQVNVNTENTSARLAALADELGFEGLFDETPAGIVNGHLETNAVPGANGSAHTNGANGKAS